MASGRRASGRAILVTLIAALAFAACAAPPADAPPHPVVTAHIDTAAEAYRAGDYTTARMAYRAARELRPTDADLALEFYRAQAALASEIDLPLDEEELRLTDLWIEQLLARYPDERARWLTARGGLRASFGDAVAAYAALTAAQEADPAYERAPLRLAALLSATERQTEAELALEDARRRFPRSLPIRKQLADLLTRRKAHKEALEVLSEALRIDRVAPIYVQMGETMLAMGDAARAEQTYREALQLVPDMPAAMAGIGYAKVAGGDFAQARFYFERYLRVAPARGVSEAEIENVRQVYTTLGKTGEAPSATGMTGKPDMRIIQTIPVETLPGTAPPLPLEPPPPQRTQAPPG